MGPYLAGDEADAPVEALLERILQVEALDNALTLAGPNVLDQGVERVVGAIVGGNNDDAPAPHQERHCGLEQLVQLIVKRSLVDQHGALLAA